MISAQGSGVMIIAMEVLKKKRRKNERQDETQFTTKIAGKTSLDPSYLFW
jgi:hypothetical protein